MKAWLPLAGLLLALATPALADERPDHFKGEPAETLEQALSNLSEYNAKLSELLAKDDLTPVDMHEVHQLTYTLENALQRLDREVDSLAETLEEVHLASESADSGTVREQGKAYLQKAGKLTR